jgi:hypothetical protein
MRNMKLKDERTAGLKRPPLILKKTQTLTIREKPKTRAMYSSTSGLNPVSDPVVELCEFLPPTLATCVPANAKNRNMVVPTNSPMAATKSIK